jgi:hypothetical protein
MLTLIVCDECEMDNHKECITNYLNIQDPNRHVDTRCCVCEVCNNND